MSEISAFIGLPRQGQNPCWQLVRHFLQTTFGLDLPDHLETRFQEKAIAAAKASATWAKVNVPQRGDVVVMETPVGASRVAPLHLGVMVSDKKLLHVDDHPRATSVCVPLDHDTVAHRIESFWRHATLN